MEHQLFLVKSKRRLRVAKKPLVFHQEDLPFLRETRMVLKELMGKNEGGCFHSTSTSTNVRKIRVPNSVSHHSNMIPVNRKRHFLTFALELSMENGFLRGDRPVDDLWGFF
jgi:hypothetical protein